MSLCVFFKHTKVVDESHLVRSSRNEIILTKRFAIVFRILSKLKQLNECLATIEIANGVNCQLNVNVRF